MKRAFMPFVFFIFVYSFTGCKSTSPLVQQNEYQRTGEQYYTITFLAYSPGTVIGKENSIAGHASLSIDRNGVWGFYPDSPGKIATKQGILKYSADSYPRMQEYVDFIVDRQIMDKIQELIRQWEMNPPYYAIIANDCVSFIYRVCDIIGLTYNPLALFPVDAIYGIRNHNDRYRIYRG